MDGPSDESFLKEFAQDSRDVLDEVMAQLTSLSSDPSLLGDEAFLHEIQTNYTALMGSAEFLGLKPVYDLSKTGVAYVKSLKEKGFDDDLTPEEFHRINAELNESLNDLEMGKTISSGSDSSGDASANPIEAPDDMDVEAMLDITISPEMLQTFSSEADEQLEATEESLLGLEKDLNDSELLDRAFGAIHTFKGNCGLFGFQELERLGHQFESILEDFKSGDITINHKGVTVLLRVLDVMKSALAALSDQKGVVEQVEDYLQMMVDYRSTGHVASIVGKSEATMLGEILVEMNAISRATLDEALVRQAQSVGEILRDMDQVDTDQVNEALEVQRQRRDVIPHSARTRKATSSQNIRVDLYKLDSLMNLVGELIVAENMVTHNPDLEGYEFENFKKASYQLNRISRELQDIAMSLRMIPIEGVFYKMKRVVRDVSQKQGKQVELIMSGEDTEVDKSVAEQISGPLLHIIRNAIDHGLESPEKRAEAGKNPIGQIHLRASHESGEVVIEISDDGVGIDRKKVIEKATASGLIQEDAQLNDQDVFNLLFQAGFSTADAVTDISGRGVGMDVVRRDIESINGRIHISSQQNKGSCFTIRIPLTLAIIEGMLVRLGKNLFTIPLLSVRETLQAKPSMISRTIDGSEMVKIREHLVPVLRLDTLFSTEADSTHLQDGILIMVEFEGYQICLFADEIVGQYQAVIKGLSSFFGAVRGISGTSIMSNGEISLILDIPGLASLYQERTAGKS